MSTTTRTPSATAAALALALLVTSLLSGTPAGASTNLGPSNHVRAHLATLEATHLLTSAPLPAGSKRLATYSAIYKAVLGGTGSVYDDPDQVTKARIYVAPDSAYASAWLSTRTIAGHGEIAKSSSSGPGSFDSVSVSYAFSATAVLPNPELTYTMVTTATGSLEFRVTAEVTWNPRKSPYSQVAGGATRVVSVVDRGLNVKKDKTTTVATTKRRLIASFLARINALPAANPALTSCPMDVGATVTMRFFRAGAATPYAKVVIDPGGCGPVVIDQFSATGVPVGTTDVEGGATLAAYVAHVLDITNVTGAAHLAG